MGLLGKLFGLNNNEKTTTLIAKNHTPVLQMLPVHSDLQDLLWIADGPRRNYTTQRNDQSMEYAGIRVTFSSYSSEEPSLISTLLPIQDAINPQNVERPPYYPSYSGLTPAQRGIYWRLLANPYNGQFDVGYVFILYYGLERHLLEGDYEKAFHVILKLRDVYDNASFQSYSACALVLTSLFRQRADLAAEFYQSLNKDYELNFSNNLYLLCKMGLDTPLTSNDLMRMAKTFEFTNLNYIKKFPDIFEKNLSEELLSKYGIDGLRIKNFISQSDWKKLHKQALPVFANISLRNQSIDIPLISECFKLKKSVYDLLEQTHIKVKNEVAEMRKTGILPMEEKPKNDKIVEPLTFNYQFEAELLKQYKKSLSNAVDKHFALIGLQDFYYKYRELDSKYLQTCIAYCNEDISILPQMQAQYKRDEKARIQQLSIAYSKSEISKKLAAVDNFNGNIPAFKRLAIIYEKSKDFNKAESICNQAISYYSEIGLISVAEEFVERKSKIAKKQAN